MRYFFGLSAIGLFVSLAAAGSPWPGSIIAVIAGAVSTVGLFAGARSLGMFDPARPARRPDDGRKEYRKAA